MLKTLGVQQWSGLRHRVLEGDGDNVLGGLVGVHLGLARGCVLWTALVTDLCVVSQSRWPVLLEVAAGLLDLPLPTWWPWARAG